MSEKESSQSQQYVERQSLKYTNKGIKIIDLTGHNWIQLILKQQAAECGLIKVKINSEFFKYL